MTAGFGWSIDDWRRELRRIGTPCAAPDATLPLGDLAAPFRAAVIERVPLAMPAAAVGTVVERADGRETGEIALWRAATDPRVDVDDVLASFGATGGPVLRQDRYISIEVWTDAELSALHALWRLARQCRRPAWRERVVVARNWHVVHTQPDNATNRPWALHVFALAGLPECDHYAQTLLHNCQATYGRPDPLSAWLLVDAAREMGFATAGG